MSHNQHCQHYLNVFEVSHHLLMLAVHLQLALQQVGCLGIDNRQLSIFQFDNR